VQHNMPHLYKINLFCGLFEPFKKCLKLVSTKK
jgi:hypothetical protein